MERITITGTNKWFDFDRAEVFAEAERFDGNNYISQATGSQWEHECLIRTAGGGWVLNSWSQWQGGRDEYHMIGDADAAAWLVAQGHDVPSDLVAHRDTCEI